MGQSFGPHMLIYTSIIFQWSLVTYSNGTCFWFFLLCYYYQNLSYEVTFEYFHQGKAMSWNDLREINFVLVIQHTSM